MQGTKRYCELPGCGTTIEDAPGRPTRRYCGPEHRAAARRARRAASAADQEARLAAALPWIESAAAHTDAAAPAPVAAVPAPASPAPCVDDPPVSPVPPAAESPAAPPDQPVPGVADPVAAPPPPVVQPPAAVSSPVPATAPSPVPVVAAAAVPVAAPALVSADPSPVLGRPTASPVVPVVAAAPEPPVSEAPTEPVGPRAVLPVTALAPAEPAASPWPVVAPVTPVTPMAPRGRSTGSEPGVRARGLAVLGAAAVLMGSYAVTAADQPAPAGATPVEITPLGETPTQWAGRAQRVLDSTTAQLDLIADTEVAWDRATDGQRAAARSAPIEALRERKQLLLQRQAFLRAQLESYRALLDAQQRLAAVEKRLAEIDAALTGLPPVGSRTPEQASTIAVLTAERDAQIAQRDALHAEVQRLEQAVAAAARTALPADDRHTALVNDLVLASLADAGAPAAPQAVRAQGAVATGGGVVQRMAYEVADVVAPPQAEPQHGLGGTVRKVVSAPVHAVGQLRQALPLPAPLGLERSGDGRSVEREVGEAIARPLIENIPGAKEQLGGGSVPLGGDLVPSVPVSGIPGADVADDVAAAFSGDIRDSELARQDPGDEPDVPDDELVRVIRVPSGLGEPSGQDGNNTAAAAVAGTDLAGPRAERRADLDEAQERWSRYVRDQAGRNAGTATSHHRDRSDARIDSDFVDADAADDRSGPFGLHRDVADEHSGFQRIHDDGSQEHSGTWGLHRDGSDEHSGFHRAHRVHDDGSDEHSGAHRAHRDGSDDHSDRSDGGDDGGDGGGHGDHGDHGVSFGGWGGGD